MALNERQALYAYSGYKIIPSFWMERGHAFECNGEITMHYRDLIDMYSEIFGDQLKALDLLEVYIRKKYC